MPLHDGHFRSTGDELDWSGKITGSAAVTLKTPGVRMVGLIEMYYSASNNGAKIYSVTAVLDFDIDTNGGGPSSSPPLVGAKGSVDFKWPCVFGENILSGSGALNVGYPGVTIENAKATFSVECEGNAFALSASVDEVLVDARGAAVSLKDVSFSADVTRETKTGGRSAYVSRGYAEGTAGGVHRYV